MVNTKMFVFKHPKYYKELREAGNELAKRNAVRKPGMSGSSPPRNKSDQVISNAEATAASERAPGPGHKPQAPSSEGSSEDLRSCKPQAKPEPSSGSQDAGRKPQAPSSRVQASSHKRQAS
jgi:hypothetical protein